MAASILTILIPVFPLISMYIFPEENRFWPTALVGFLPERDHTAVYVLLIISGINYTIGCLFLVRGFGIPQPRPFFSFNLFATDEVASSWFFVFGTVPAVPITAIYVYYFPHSTYFGAALACCLFATIVMVAFTYTVYPPSDPNKVLHIALLL